LPQLWIELYLKAALAAVDEYKRVSERLLLLRPF
jgi:hypothetical protein